MEKTFEKSQIHDTNSQVRDLSKIYFIKCMKKKINNYRQKIILRIGKGMPSCWQSFWCTQSGINDNWNYLLDYQSFPRLRAFFKLGSHIFIGIQASIYAYINVVILFRWEDNLQMLQMQHYFRTRKGNINYHADYYVENSTSKFYSPSKQEI